MHRIQTIKLAFYFRWATSYIKYLGILIAADLTRVFNLNYRTKISVDMFKDTKQGQFQLVWPQCYAKN